MYIKRWDDVLQKINQLAPFFNKSNIIEQRSRYHIIFNKFLSKFQFYIEKAISSCLN
jgi:hypothetical protein